MTGEFSDQLLLWQLADTAFPMGGFTHSGGLEAACQHGEVTTIGELRHFCDAAAWQAGHAGLPCLCAAHDDPRRLAELDALVEAFLANRVANHASRLQGRSLVSVCARAFPGEAMTGFDEAVRRGALAGHLAPLFGAVFRTLGVTRRDASRLYVYLAVRGVIGAAVRLGILGPIKAQQLQAALRADVERVVQRCESLEPGDLAHSSPVWDLYQGTHDRLYSRLFQS